LSLAERPGLRGTKVLSGVRITCGCSRKVYNVAPQRTYTPDDAGGRRLGELAEEQDTPVIELAAEALAVWSGLGPERVTLTSTRSGVAGPRPGCGGDCQEPFQAA
jgi:hypothetical protein